MPIPIFVNVLQSLLNHNVSHVLRIFWMKKSRKFLKGEACNSVIFREILIIAT